YRDTSLKNIDREDISIRNDQLVIADIGDNQAVRSEVSFHLLEQPYYHDSLNGRLIIAPWNAETFSLKYPDGARDAEAFFIDPQTGDWFIVTKRESRARLYVWPLDFQKNKKDTLLYGGSFPFNTVTGADLSRDGNQLLIRTYLDIYTWTKGTLHWKEVLASAPKRMPYQGNEIQG